MESVMEAAKAQNWAVELQEETIIFLKFFYYFGHIIIELGNVNMFQDHEVCHKSAIILLFSYY
jgi:hypothetical protein